MGKPLNILIVEDSPDDAELMLSQLRRDGFDPQWSRVETEVDFLAELKKTPDIILSDYSLPEFSGLRAVELLQQSGRQIPFILISGTVGEDAAVEAMKHGAMDYLLKDRMTRLGHAVEHALRETKERVERKRMVELLRESELKFRQLTENIREVFWITDPAKKRMLYISPAYETVLGRTCQSLYESPKSWIDAIHPDDRERIQQAMLTQQVSGTYNEEYRILRPDGTERWIHDQAFPVKNPAGEVERIVGVAEDITERRRLEAQFRQSQKMESIGQLAGGIAHDFNNILSAIVGYVYLAKLAAAKTPAALEYLDNVSNAAQRATDLVNQILTFSRQNKQDREPIKLNPVILEALKLLRASVPTTINIETELEETPAVLANATAIHQVIMNLGTNAMHAMHGQPGTFKISMSALDADADLIAANPDLHPGRYVQLSVSDSGCGMDRTTLERIFDPFFTTKPTGKGTGLGLAVVHGIVKNHGGGISVYSHPGEGTVFRLYFPVVETQEVPQNHQTAPIPRGHGEHILFVDDEDALAIIGKKMLEGLGYVVTTKNNPVDAIAAFREKPGQFHLVITDLTMPGMDGLKFGSQVLKIQPRQPIILMTGYSGAMTADKIRKMGFRELVGKPCTIRQLGETVHRVLQPPV